MSLRRAGHSSRGVLPSVVCLSVIVKPRQFPGPLGAVAPFGGGSVLRHHDLLNYRTDVLKTGIFRKTAIRH
jgi:hypothetical protein